MQSEMACVWYLLQKAFSAPNSPIQGSGSKSTEYTSERNLNIHFQNGCILLHDHREWNRVPSNVLHLLQSGEIVGYILWSFNLE